MPNSIRLLKYVPPSSSPFSSHQNISKNIYFQITNGSKISLRVPFKYVTRKHVITWDRQVGKTNVPRNTFETDSRPHDHYSESGQNIRGCRGLLE